MFQECGPLGKWQTHTVFRLFDICLFYNLWLMVSFYEWSFFSIKLSYQIVHWNADSADQIPKKRCLLFKWEEWKKQSEKYKTKKHEKISFTEWVNSVIPFFYPGAALKALPIESCTNLPNSAEYLRQENRAAPPSSRYQRPPPSGHGLVFLHLAGSRQIFHWSPTV